MSNSYIISGLNKELACQLAHLNTVATRGKVFALYDSRESITPSEHHGNFVKAVEKYIDELIKQRNICLEICKVIDEEEKKSRLGNFLT